MTNVIDVLQDPLAQELLASAIPARLAYVAKDGTPRVIPIGFWWNGSDIVLCTATSAPKVATLQANPTVALTIDTNDQPPHVLMIRGDATVDIVDGVPSEYLDASRKLIPAEAWDDFVEQVTGLYETMAKITVRPTWAKVLDFETRAPDFLTQLLHERAGAG
jgi:hypothetical protein